MHGLVPVLFEKSALNFNGGDYGWISPEAAKQCELKGIGKIVDPKSIPAVTTPPRPEEVTMRVRWLRGAHGFNTGDLGTISKPLAMAYIERGDAVEAPLTKAELGEREEVARLRKERDEAAQSVRDTPKGAPVKAKA